MPTNPPARRKVATIRTTSSIVIGAITILIVVFLLGDAIAKAAWTSVLAAAPWFALIVYLAFEVLLWPRVDVFEDGAAIVNPWRTWQVPRADVTRVRAAMGLALTTHGGTVVRAWGAPMPRKGNAPDVTELPDWLGTVNVEGETESAKAPAAGARATWRWIEIGIGAAIVVWCVLGIIL